MPSDTAVIVSDAHLGSAPPEVALAFHRFLGSVPAIAGHLIINGDLFDFWFEYRSVIPRAAFPTLACLAEVRKAGVRLTVTGGNHDRWGGRFWKDELGGEFHRKSAELSIAGHQTVVRHGDGIAEQQIAARAMHAITRNPFTAAAFRLIHPDVGFWFVKHMSRSLAARTREGAILDAAANGQREYARRLLETRADLDMVILSHTHRPAAEQIEPGRWFLNPGAWMDSYRYAVVTKNGPELCRFEYSEK